MTEELSAPTPDQLQLNDDGTIEVLLDDGKVHLPRPKIGAFRSLSEAMERADAIFRELMKFKDEDGNESFPSDILELATQAAMDEIGVPRGNNHQKEMMRQSIIERQTQYANMLFNNRLLQSAANPFPEVWQAVLSVLGNVEIAIDDMPTWMCNPLSLGTLREHWMAVPLRLGPQTNRAADGQTTNTPSPSTPPNSEG